MKCHYCGAEVPAGKNYCMWCGTRQTDRMPAEQPKTPEIPVIDPIREEFPEIRPVMAAPAPVAAPAPAATPIPVKAAEKTLDRPNRNPPQLKLPAERGLGKMFFLGLLTAGIYPTVIWSRIVTELNIAASRYDGERTVSYFGMLMLSPITFGIYPLVWMHHFCDRISRELARRNSDYKFGPSDFWLWGVLGSLILAGPLVFTHKLMHAMNKINTHYNVYG